MTARILMIDHDQTRRDMAAAALRQAGFRLDTRGPEDVATLGTGGVAALVWAEGHPTLDDAALVASLRRDGAVRVALIPAEHGGAEALRSVSDAVLALPFSIEALRIQLEEWCGAPEEVALARDPSQLELPRPKPPTRLRPMTMHIPTVVDAPEDHATLLPLPVVGGSVPRTPIAVKQTPADAAPAAAPMVQGNLAESGVAQLLGQMYMEAFTGRLHLQAPDGRGRTMVIEQGVPFALLPEMPEEDLHASLVQCFAWQEGSYGIEATAPTGQTALVVPPLVLIWEGVTQFYPEEALRDWLRGDGRSYVVATAYFAPRAPDLPPGLRQSGLLEHLTGERTAAELLNGSDLPPHLAQALYVLLITGMVVLHDQPGPPIDAALLGIAPHQPEELTLEEIPLEEELLEEIPLDE